MQNKYGNLASQVYEADKPYGVSFGDVEYYLERLKDVEGLIFEPGVGNGRFLIPLLKAGKLVTGCDSSKEMLNLAEAALRKNGLTASLICSSFEGYETQEKFEAIVIPAGTFQLISSFDAAHTVLSKFYHQLQHNGRLMFDLDASQLIFNVKPSVRQWPITAEEVITLSSTPVEIDYVAQTTKELHRYELWQSGQLIKTELEEFVLRWWSISEIKLLLQAIGFTNVTISGNYQYQKEPENNDQLISIEATKAIN